MDNTFATAAEFTAIFTQLVQEIKQRFVGASYVEQERLYSLLKQYEKYIRQVMPNADAWIDRNIRDYFMQGDLFAQIALQDFKLSAPINTQFTQVHEGALIAVAQAMKKYQHEAVEAQVGTLRSFIKRIQTSSEDQKAVLDEIARAVLLGDDTLTTSKNISKRLTARAVGGYVQVGDKVLPLNKYAELLARTNLRVAYTQGTLTRLKTNGIKLVIISEHGTECKICGPLEGKIFSIQGTHPVYPPLRALPNMGTPFHPNCLHVVLPFSEELADQEELDFGLVSKEDWPFANTLHLIPS